MIALEYKKKQKQPWKRNFLYGEAKLSIKDTVDKNKQKIT